MLSISDLSIALNGMKNHTQQQTFHIGFLHKTELESWHFYYRLKLIVFFSVKKQITISNTVIKTQGKFYLCFTNSNNNFFLLYQHCHQYHQLVLLLTQSSYSCNY